MARKVEIGSVFQISEKYPNKGWVGAFVLATEINPWGISGFVANVHTHEEQRRLNVRLKWNETYYIGIATLVPKSVADKGEYE